MELLLTLWFGLIQLVSPPADTLLMQIKAEGELRVATRAGPDAYYYAGGEAEGLEVELARRFAGQLGVRLEIAPAGEFAEIFRMVRDQRVHFAAASLAAGDQYRSEVRFGPSYRHSGNVVVYRRTEPRPRSLETLSRLSREKVLACASEHTYRLRQLQAKYPELVWSEYQKSFGYQLLEYVSAELFDYAVISAHEFAQMRHLYPQLEVALELPEEQELAWAFPRFGNDDSLYLAASQFFNRLRDSGELARLMARYDGPGHTLHHLDLQAFHRHIEERLPLYQARFLEAAEERGVDWRLLAAIAYQESLWDAEAVSYTGVRGLMMLTEAAAAETGVSDRRDPLESIAGGARYFVSLKERLPAGIADPDRTWMALASYNMGLGHLLDARRLAVEHDGNPNHWIDVEKYLRLLSMPYWYTQTRHGYARGYETLAFVRNVRSFYDILLRKGETENAAPPPSIIIKEATAEL